MNAEQIDAGYNDLVNLIEREFRRLKQIIAEQENKAEEERLRKIQVDQIIERIDFD